MLSKKRIQKRVKELASFINSQNYKHLTLIVILNGSLYFASDLSRLIKIPLRIECISLHMERNQSSSGAMRFRYNGKSIEKGATVLIVEDIVRSGLTLHWLRDLLIGNGVEKLLIATLLYVKNSSFPRHLLDYIGFDVKDHYYVGYGLDFNGKYRNLDFITTFDTKE